MKNFIKAVNRIVLGFLWSIIFFFGLPLAFNKSGIAAICFILVMFFFPVFIKALRIASQETKVLSRKITDEEDQELMKKIEQAKRKVRARQKNEKVVKPAVKNEIDMDAVRNEIEELTKAQPIY